ncbi:MAG: hypothetical protein ABIA63_10360 [bacterium]
MDTSDFERYLAKNARMAKAYDTSGQVKDDGVPDSERALKKTCFNCNLKRRCNDFKLKRSGGTGGSVSIGDDTIFICEKWQAFLPNTKDKKLSEKQVKSMLKNALKGRL